LTVAVQSTAWKGLCSLTPGQAYYNTVNIMSQGRQQGQGSESKTKDLTLITKVKTVLTDYSRTSPFQIVHYTLPSEE